MLNKDGQLDTLEKEPAFPIDTVPPVPRYQILTAHGGEKNYRLNPTCQAASVDPAADPDWWIGFNKRVNVHAYTALKGDILVSPNLRVLTSWDHNLEHRIMIRQRTENDKVQQDIQMELCRSSVLYWFNTFVWTKDPRLDIKVIPFVTYPFQDTLIRRILWAVQNKKTHLIEKSREMGATWVVEAVATYTAIFYPHSSNYQFSLTEADVDDYTENSLLGKSRFIIEKLPSWMRGGWAERRQGIDKSMMIRLPDTGSVIQGKLTGGTAGVGGRATWSLYDEFAVLGQKDPNKDKAAMQAAASLADSQIILSTPRGSGNEFAKMAKHPQIEKSSLHWTQHPLKSTHWAVVERSRPIYNDERWASEQEISYEVSTQGRVYPEFTSRSFSEDKWSHVQTSAYYEYDPMYPVYAAIDFGIADPTVILFCQLKPAPTAFPNEDDQCLIVFDYESSPNKMKSYWIDRLQRRPYNYAAYIADMRSAVQKNDDLVTRKMTFAAAGIPLQGHGFKRNAIGPIDEVRTRLTMPGAVAIHERCTMVIEAFQSWAWDIDPVTGFPMNRKDPKHLYSDSMKAFAYLVDWLYYRTAKKEDSYSDSQDWNFKVMDNYPKEQSLPWVMR